MTSTIKTKFKNIFKRRPAGISPMACTDDTTFIDDYCADYDEYKTPRSTRFCNKPIHDPQFECCFCYHETGSSRKNISARLAEIDLLYDNENRTDIDTGRIPSHRYFDRDCSIMESGRHKMTEPAKLNLFFENNPKLIKFYRDLSNHDRRIIDCMIAKRSNELLHTEDAFIAHQHWANESTLNKKLMGKYQKIYNNLINRKNHDDHEQLVKRLNYLASLDTAKQNKLRVSLAQRDTELQKRLNKLRSIRKYCVDEKNFEARNRVTLNTLNSYENNLDTEIKLIACLNRLDDKLQTAERNRATKLAHLKCKIKTENDIIRNLNEFNKQELKNYERLKKFQLQEYIGERDRKYRKFLDDKQKYYSELNERARRTAEFRDLIRSSITPDNMCFKVKHYRNITDRSISSAKTNYTTPF